MLGTWPFRPYSFSAGYEETSDPVVETIMAKTRLPVTGALGRGVLSGLAGTAVMTAFQKIIEMPLTGRSDSYAPASFAEKVLPVHPATRQGRKKLNYGTHFALGTLWGSAYGLAAHAGLRGPRAVAAVFSVVYSSDVLLNTALGLYHPSTWSRQDWAVDVVDKLVQAAATGVVYDRVLARESGVLGVPTGGGRLQALVVLVLGAA